MCYSTWFIRVGKSEGKVFTLTSTNTLLVSWEALKHALHLNVQSAYKRGGTGSGNSHFFEIFEFARQRRTNKMAAKTSSRLVHDTSTLYEHLQAVVRMLYLASYEP